MVKDSYRSSRDGLPSRVSNDLLRVSPQSPLFWTTVVLVIALFASTAANIWLNTRADDENQRLAEVLRQLEETQQEIDNLRRLNDEALSSNRRLQDQNRSLTTELEEINLELADIRVELANSENAARTGMELIRRTLRAIDGSGTRLNEQEISYALSTDVSAHLQSIDIERLEQLAARFERYDLDNDERLDREEVAIAVFR